MPPHIAARGLGKRYRIGAAAVAPDTLRDFIATKLRPPKRDLGYVPFWALRDVSFDVAAGEVVGIVGPNGAGKTTLLKILSRITPPTEGCVDIEGRMACLLEVGTGFHAELTGRENVFLNGAILGMRRAEIVQKFDEIVAFAEVEKFIDTPVKHYSSGMHLRLAFAVAAHLEPEILVVDEVLAVGDMAFQKKCLGKMQDVAGQGRTVLFVSHNMSAVTALCSRGILLNEGRIARMGSASEVVADYLRGVSGTSARRTWPSLDQAPGTGGFKLWSVSVLDEQGRSAAVTDVERPIRLRLEYHVGVPSLSFRVAASLFTQGVCAFASVEPTETAREGPGWYASEVEIPANLLAEYDYTVNVSVFSSRGRKNHLCQLNDLVAFQVIDARTGRSSRGDYAEGLLGVTRPLLLWQQRKIEPPQHAC